MKRVTLETFIALAQLGHFGKVAHQLNTTQSTVSARIAGMEQDLGAVLFNRTSNAVTLTPKGRDILHHATEVIAAMDRMSRAVGIDPYREGTLRLGVSETLASTILPAFVKVFADRFPGSTVEIIVNNTTGQRDQLLDRSLDLALLMGPVSNAIVANLPLLDLPLIWAVATDHPLAHEEEITAEALAEFPILSYATNSRPYIELTESLRRAGVTAPKLFSSNALGASVAITRARLAVCTLPRIYADPHLQGGSLAEIKVPVPLNPLSFTASFRTEPGNELARAAAQIAAEVAREWGDGSSKFAIDSDQKRQLDSI